MTRKDSDWVYERFAASARDWTPASLRHAAHVLYTPVSRDPEALQRCASVLSDAELQRAKRFLVEESTAHFIERRAFRRYCAARALGSRKPLSQIVFTETEKGRPYLSAAPEFWFSFSSCRFGFLGAWSRTRAIGADIEDQTRDVEAVELARRFFSQAEAKAVEEACDPARLRTFFHFWSLKEAALKSIGEGLPFGLDAFQFELAHNPRVVCAPPGYGGLERFRVYVIEETYSCAALVTHARNFRP